MTNFLKWLFARDELDELDRWRTRCTEAMRWLAGNHEVRLVLGNLQATAAGKPEFVGPGDEVFGTMHVSDLRARVTWQERNRRQLMSDLNAAEVARLNLQEANNRLQSELALLRIRERDASVENVRSLQRSTQMEKRLNYMARSGARFVLSAEGEACYLLGNNGRILSGAAVDGSPVPFGSSLAAVDEAMRRDHPSNAALVRRTGQGIEPIKGVA